MSFRSKILAPVAGVSLAFVPFIASASGPSFDTGDATAALTTGLTAIAAIGVAALVMVVVAKVWKRLRGVA